MTAAVTQLHDPVELARRSANTACVDCGEEPLGGGPPRPSSSARPDEFGTVRQVSTPNRRTGVYGGGDS